MAWEDLYILKRGETPIILKGLYIVSDQYMLLLSLEYAEPSCHYSIGSTLVQIVETWETSTAIFSAIELISHLLRIAGAIFTAGRSRAEIKNRSPLFYPHRSNLGLILLEYYQLNSGMRALCLSREKINSHWLKGCVFVFKPMRVAPLLG